MKCVCSLVIFEAHVEINAKNQASRLRVKKNSCFLFHSPHLPSLLCYIVPLNDGSAQAIAMILHEMCHQCCYFFCQKWVSLHILPSRNGISNSRNGISSSRNGISNSGNGISNSRNGISNSRNGISVNDGAFQPRVLHYIATSPELRAPILVALFSSTIFLNCVRVKVSPFSSFSIFNFL